MSNGHGNFEPGGMAMMSPPDQNALRNEQYQEHQRKLQEKYELQYKQQMELAQTSTHPHDPAPNEGNQPYYTSQGQLVIPTPSSCYQARPQYGLADFELLETLD
ncbi:hypothetical protein BCR41DRAFT_40405 [Lobosporangium transversale]|uniref:Uncharacterized protein n=1 Tax=Lobosporangium transversale TaxID=64571 RepID=A0A1Y2GS38_9FUNG|nr:hypothetical protein BCR41DRAFT_40405 [Lobosporangium transversale]ORZ19180.1 hypothetical protein BCR41DRAFT_40405 [Lobosporangium transversale]|eukprot:XP_021882348.1 hypothetical protein BCR41DRAFT_40405 [Lobosporangium transversale]